MTRFSEEWYDRKQAAIAEWKRREAARSAAPAATPPRALPSLKAAGTAPIYPLVGLCRAAGLPEPVPEYRFHPVRKWRFDYAWPLHKIALEVEGGVWTQGRHTRGAGFVSDMEKYNAAALLGFLLLRYTPDQLARSINDLRIALAA